MRTFRRPLAPWRILSDKANAALGRRVREHRRAAGLCQIALGRRSNVGSRFISDVELGRGNPSLGTMAMIADALGCTVADLVRDDRPVAPYLCEADMHRVRDALRSAMAVLRRGAP